MPSERQALVVYLAINQTFLNDSNYSLSDYSGRINLYCFLLCQIFGKPLIQKCLAIDSANNLEHLMAVKNVLIPNTLEELNVRLRFLWSSITDIHTVAMEGQKRQTCSIWNEMGLQVTNTPIPGFFSLSTMKPLRHRTTPNYDSGPLKMLSALSRSSKAFFARAKAPVETRCYPLHSGAGGITTLVAWALKTESKKFAEKNIKVQQRLANTYLAEVISSVIADETLVNCVIVPDSGEEAIDMQTVEKDLLKQNVFQRFNVMEKFADKV